MTVRAVVQLAVLLGLVAAAGAADDPLAATLRGVVEDNLRAYDAEDAEGAIRAVHTRSPAYEPTKAEIAEQFRDLDISAKLAHFTYIGHDDEFAVARVKIQLEAPPDSVFINNTTDSIVLFHQEGGVWKLWTEEILGIDFEQPTGVVAPPK